MALCERFGCLPSQLMGEPVDLLRMVNMVDLYRTRDDDSGGSYGE